MRRGLGVGVAIVVGALSLIAVLFGALSGATWLAGGRRKGCLLPRPRRPVY